MGSSNRHWPSMFKSNPSCAAAHHHRQHEINHSTLFSGHCQKPNSYASGAEEKSPEPKPRWNPKPEQIRILESIFNSGMVNPPRDEIRRIRDQLQVYGHVGDANVFYWFQNRKSRSKLKLRHLKSAAAAAASAARSAPTTSVTASSSSTSSDRSSSASPAVGSLAAFFQAPVLTPDELLPETSAFLPNPCGELAGGIEAGMSYLGMLALLGSFTDAVLPPPNSTTAPTANGLEVVPRSTIFINEIAYEVAERRVNIREAFGENTFLIHSSGHPVLTDEWGFTLHPLQHGSSYYLV